MKHGIWVLAGFMSVATACGDGEKGLGEQVGSAISDIHVVKEAEAAANKIIRNASDCEFVRAEVEGVVQTLDDVESEIQTATGRTTMDTLRVQVRRAAEACGAPIR